jgi:porin
MRWKALPIAVAMAAVAGPAMASQDEDRPVRWGGLIVVDVWSLLEGGEDPGTTVMLNATGSVDVDAERAWGWSGVTVHGSVLYAGDEAFSADRVGDGQVISNIETGVEVLRPYEVWIERRWAPGAVSVRAGFYDFNSEFDALEQSALFLNSSHGIGADIAQSGENGPLIFPAPGLALRVQGDPAENWTVRGVIGEGTPGDAARPERNRLILSREEGVFAAVEIERRLGEARVLLGGWTYSARFPDLQGLAVPAERTGNGGVYLRAESDVWVASDGSRTVSAFGRLGLADDRTNAIDTFVSGGLVMQGPLRGRPDDMAGLAFAYTALGGPARRLRTADGALTPRNELNIEATWRIALSEGLALQPSIQFVDTPQDSGADQAWTAGLRLEISR